MLVFDPNDPFPLLTAPVPYAEAQAHSERADAWLGLKPAAIEARLRSSAAVTSPDHNLWLHLPIQAMLTPYTELRWVLARLNPEPGATIVDLGAGYARLAFVLQRHWPEVNFIGYELAAARLEEARRVLHGLGLAPRIQLLVADLCAADFTPPDAAAYFLYDYGTRAAIAKTLGDLRTIARRRPIILVGRGRATRDAVERGEPWLSDVVAPEHLGNFSIYRSAGD